MMKKVISFCFFLCVENKYVPFNWGGSSDAG